MLAENFQELVTELWADHSLHTRLIYVLFSWFPTFVPEAHLLVRAAKVHTSPSVVHDGLVGDEPVLLPEAPPPVITGLPAS